MNQFKKCKVVRLESNDPIEDEDIIYVKHFQSGRFILKDELQIAYKTPNSNRVMLRRNGMDITDEVSEGLIKKQHLYILSDDEIKEGDWFYHEISNIVSNNYNLFVKQSGKGHIMVCKKIIATTDKSLTIHNYNDVNRLEDFEFSLPRPSYSFIQKYCELGGIDEVLVEYEILYDIEQLPVKPIVDIESRVKIAPDNTITIKKIKDSWSREEVIDLINEHSNMIDKSIDYEAHYSACCNVPIPSWDDDNWIEKNL